MKFAYEDLSEDQFERLIVFLCQRVLGIGVQGFAKGPDGGRDARFVGTAELYPSTARPWQGTVIVQAKHTIGYNRTFSESDFFSPASKSCVVAKELVRLKQLRDAGEVDHYMLFANRRLAANADSEIRSFLSRHSGIPDGSIYLGGVEQLEAWLKRFPEVARNADFDPIESPLLVSPDELAEVILAFGRQQEAFANALASTPRSRVSYEKKNTLNNTSDRYADALRKRYLKETAEIHAFLASPINHALVNTYESAVAEFQLKIIAKRTDSQTFDNVMEHLFDTLVGRDPDLAKHRRLVRLMLFYMYWNCDIGENGDAETDETLAS